MANFFNSVRITNFKSLKDVTLSDCKRINLLIGKPNVGKSNILEALGLFGMGCLHFNKNKKLTQLIRFENAPELFFDGDIKEIISVIINNGEHECRVKQIRSNSDPSYDGFDNQMEVRFSDKNNADKHTNLLINNHLNVAQTASFVRSKQSKIRQYKFTSDIVPEKQSQNIPYLIPPFGGNLIEVIQGQKQLRSELSKVFDEYGLKILIDKTNNTLRIMKTLKEDGTLLSLPYSSIADSLQRIIFFKAAIASNENSILIFEEPEAHCFPPYIAQITQEVIGSETNQFFIATHSPYVLNDFLEDTKIDLAIYMVDFQDGQTVVYRLSDEELDEIYTYGIDVFFNYERFTAHG